MCSPTMFLAAGGAMQAISAIAAGNFADDIAARNQAALNLQAEGVIEAGVIQEQEQRTKTAQLKGQQKTAFAASGVDISAGSPVDILSDTAAIGELDALTIRSGAETEAYNLRMQGESEALQGKLAKRQGYSTAFGSLLTTSGSVAAL